MVNGPHDVPTAHELVEAVREWIQRELQSSDDGHSRYHARVAANVLGIVERELELGPAQALRHGDRLRSLGVADDTELAAAIRDGSLDDRLDEVRTAVYESVLDKLAVANPSYRADQPAD